MGVLACDRKGCKNIMCDGYSCKYGYICYDCFSELLEYNDRDINKFMNTIKEKKLYNDDFSWKAFCNNEFEFR